MGLANHRIIHQVDIGAAWSQKWTLCYLSRISKSCIHVKVQHVCVSTFAHFLWVRGPPAVYAACSCTIRSAMPHATSLQCTVMYYVFLAYPYRHVIPVNCDSKSIRVLTSDQSLCYLSRISTTTTIATTNMCTLACCIQF